MSRQLEIKQEERETKRRDAIFKALEYGIVGALEGQGATLRGFSIRYDTFTSQLTLRVDFEGKWFVAHISSDTMANCILATARNAHHGRLNWVRDKYQPNEV